MAATIVALAAIEVARVRASRTLGFSLLSVGAGVHLHRIRPCGRSGPAGVWPGRTLRTCDPARPTGGGLLRRRLLSGRLLHVDDGRFPPAGDQPENAEDDVDDGPEHDDEADADSGAGVAYLVARVLRQAAAVRGVARAGRGAGNH